MKSTRITEMLAELETKPQDTCTEIAKSNLYVMKLVEELNQVLKFYKMGYLIQIYKWFYVQAERACTEAYEEATR